MQASQVLHQTGVEPFLARRHRWWVQTDLSVFACLVRFVSHSGVDQTTGQRPLVGLSPPPVELWVCFSV